MQCKIVTLQFLFCTCEVVNCSEVVRVCIEGHDYNNNYFICNLLKFFLRERTIPKLSTVTSTSY
jgi:hypothetical protein